MTQLTNNVFAFTDGPKHAEVLVVGEAWGQEESRAQRPFVGQSGLELRKMLNEAGILTSNVLFANVVNAWPGYGNEFTKFLEPTKDKAGTRIKGLYAKQVLVDGLDKLKALIATLQPKLIIGCGNIPLWALTSHANVTTTAGYKLPSGVSSWRGSQTFTEDINGTSYPYLPIIHPAAILRDWSLRSPTIHDLRARAARFLTGKTSWLPDSVRQDIRPDGQTAKLYLRTLIRQADRSSKPIWISTDIETYQRRQLACIGFATNELCFCIPFFYFKGETCYDVYSFEDEASIVLLIRNLLRHPNVRIVGQNYLYDYQWLLRLFGIQTAVAFDTMLAHHLLFPGTPKGLDYLASMYCNHYLYWKEESEDWAGGDPENLWRYNCKDVLATLEIANELKLLLEQASLSELYQDRLYNWRLGVKMMNTGMRVDAAERNASRSQLNKAAHELEAYLISCVPENTRYAPTGRPWFTSPKLTGDLFYRQLGLTPVLHKKTKKPTTDAQALDKIGKDYPYLYPITERLDRLRSINVFISHFYDIKLDNNRFSCNYNVAGTETFRWSSSANAFGEGTNLQNIPKGEEE